MLRRQAAVRSGGGFLRRKLSALDDQPWSNMNSAKKASWLGVKDIHEVNRVDLHPSLVGDMQENFQAMSDDRAVFENVPSTVLQPKSACASCLEVCGGNH